MTKHNLWMKTFSVWKAEREYKKKDVYAVRFGFINTYSLKQRMTS